jgi:hypothetical protein
MGRWIRLVGALAMLALIGCSPRTTPEPSATPTTAPTVTSAPTNTPSSTPTLTATRTPTFTPTATPTSTPSPTCTSTPTSTPTPTDTPTRLPPTATPGPTWTPDPCYGATSLGARERFAFEEIVPCLNTPQLVSAFMRNNVSYQQETVNEYAQQGLHTTEDTVTVTTMPRSSATSSR